MVMSIIMQMKQFCIALTATPASAVAGLQTAFDAFQRSLISHKPVLNSNKTKCMLFSRCPRVDTSLGIHTPQGEQIEIVNSYKYLGIWLDTKLSFRTHVEHQKAEKKNWLPV